MKPFRKPFFGDPLFSFQQVYNTVKNPEMELPDHLHDHYELVYVHKGKGIFFIDQTWYEKKAGDLFIIPGNTIHRALPDQDDPIVSSAIFFAPSMIAAGQLDEGYSHLYCYEWAKKRKGYRLIANEVLRGSAKSAMEKIASELQEKRAGYREAIKLIVCGLLLEINRSCLENSHEGGQSRGSRIGPQWMLEALREIDEHPEREVGLARLAQKANVSPPHFSRVFRQLTAMNLTGYVNAKRIIKAKELLLQSDENVNVIGDQCGFETPTHFYRVFKSITGVTPKAYRNSGP
jgi:AraC-like DNA-binding protein